MSETKFYHSAEHFAINSMMEDVAEVNKTNGWFDSERSVGEDIALLHSEVSEMLEAYRHNDMKNFAEEAADVLIRLLDTCYRREVDLYAEYSEKMEKNAKRGYRHGGKAL